MMIGSKADDGEGVGAGVFSAALVVLAIVSADSVCGIGEASGVTSGLGVGEFCGAGSDLGVGDSFGCGAGVGDGTGSGVTSGFISAGVSAGVGVGVGTFVLAASGSVTDGVAVTSATLASTGFAPIFLSSPSRVPLTFW